jgi:hypothetical protein
VRIDLGVTQIRMTQQILHRADVTAPFQQFCCKSVPERLAACWFANSGGFNRMTHNPLNGRNMPVMMGHIAKIVGTERGRRKKPLPL